MARRVLRLPLQSHWLHRSLYGESEHCLGSHASIQGTLPASGRGEITPPCGNLSSISFLYMEPDTLSELLDKVCVVNGRSTKERVANDQHYSPSLFDNPAKLAKNRVHIGCVALYPAPMTGGKSRPDRFIHERRDGDGRIFSWQRSFRPDAGRSNFPERFQAMSHPYERQPMSPQVIDRVEIWWRGERKVEAIVLDFSKRSCIRVENLRPSFDQTGLESRSHVASRSQESGINVKVVGIGHLMRAAMRGIACQGRHHFLRDNNPTQRDG